MKPDFVTPRDRLLEDRKELACREAKAALVRRESKTAGPALLARSGLHRGRLAGERGQPINASLLEDGRHERYIARLARSVVRLMLAGKVDLAIAENGLLNLAIKARSPQQVARMERALGLR